MKYCPISGDMIPDTEQYAPRGLRLLSPQLKTLTPLAYSAAEQRQEALNRVGKMSIQGVQKKLSAQLRISAGCFELVDQYGHYILKPQSDDFPELPENEALSMSLAATIGLRVPIHGLIWSKDNTLTYFIKRFDRLPHHKKLAVEDFAQLSGAGRDTKYQSSMEKVIAVITRFCSFPKIEYIHLLKMTIFNFLIGNEDMHLKNFSLITKNNVVSLSPAYDLLNSTIALNNQKEEIALPLHGKKNQLTQRDFFTYLAQEQLQLQPSILENVIQTFRTAIPQWEQAIARSYLSASMQTQYKALLTARCARLGLY